MFEKYLIVENTLRNVGPAGAATGFAFEARLGYYRGLGLSMIETLEVTVDGEAAPREAIRFDEGPGPLSLDEMETAYDRRWPFGAKATVTVLRPGGLTPGPHDITFTENLRISYMPFPGVRIDRKTETVA